MKFERKKNHKSLLKKNSLPEKKTIITNKYLFREIETVKCLTRKRDNNLNGI